MAKAVIFDLDNTLYDYDQCHEKAMEVLKRSCMKKFQITANVFEEIFERSKALVKKQAGNTGASHNRILYMQNFLEQLNQKPVLYALDLYNIYWDAMLNHMQPFEYVVPLFEELIRRKIRIAILTDMTAHIQHRKIQQLGIAEYIDVLVTSEEAGAEKPNIKMFELVKNKLGTEMAEMIMVGDSFDKDIKGAVDCGMQGVWCQKNNRQDMIERCLKII